jgi:hypothetical protein
MRVSQFKYATPLRWSESMGLILGGGALMALPFALAAFVLPAKDARAASTCISEQFHKNGFEVASSRTNKPNGSVVGYNRGAGMIEVSVSPSQAAHISMTVRSAPELPAMQSLIGDVTRSCLKSGATPT